MNEIEVKKVDSYRWEIPKKGDMLVPGRIYGDQQIIDHLVADVKAGKEWNALKQIENVACLPGIQKASLAMSDVHPGYGFCCHPDTKILSSFGYFLPIKDYKKIWKKEKLKTLDKDTKEITQTKISKFLKIKARNKVFKLTTKSGKEITATADHPFLTKKGMVDMEKLCVGSEVAVLPFEGVAYENPPKRIIVSEKDVEKTLRKLGRFPGEIGFDQNIAALKKRGLLKLSYDHPKLPYLIKIMGFVFGDGTMNFIGKKGDGIIGFSGKGEDLEKIRQDIKALEYVPSPINTRRGNNSSFVVNATSLMVLLKSLGQPMGRKVFQAYDVPKWIINAPLWQKRLFLASLFGVELRGPHLRKGKETMFNCPVFPMSKSEDLIQNGEKFLTDISKMLKEFGVETRDDIVKRKKHINVKKEVSWHLELVVSSKIESLINLWSKIGFEYNTKRSFEANVAVQYLRYKQRVLKEKEYAVKVLIPALLKTELSYRKIAKKLANDIMTERFISSVCCKLKKNKKVMPNVSPSFPRFSEHMKKSTTELRNSGLVWDEIVELKEVLYDDDVYDFTVPHKDHNFIANNFVVSNCIGGVGAFDTREGVISVAGVGFDCNCLSGDSKILHEFGYTKRIEEFKTDFQNQNIKCVNPTSKVLNTKIKAFFSIVPKKRVFKVKTESGREIVATEDHPFFTPEGMVRLGELEEQPISIYPFEGVEHVVPKNDIIVSEEDIRSLPIDKKVEQTIDELKKRDILPLRMDNPKLPYLLKLMGFVYGDGCIYFTGKWKKGCTAFYGKREDLEDIRSDIEKIGFKPSKVYARNRDHSIDTQYGVVEFNQTEESCKSTSSALATLLWAMGTPINNKTTQDYELPKWLFKCEKWQMRLFLAALFGAELSSPNKHANHEFTLSQPVMSLNKKAKNVKSGRRFLNQISELLSEFDIESRQIRERKEYMSKDGQISIRLRLAIRAMPENYMRLWSRIGFEYNKEKQFLACAAVQYLKFKELVIRQRKWAASEAKILKKGGFSKSEINDKLAYGFVNKRFIERSLYEGRKTSPRIAFDFYTFKKFINKFSKGLGKTGQFWEKIVEITPIEFSKKVFDFNVDNEHHNFIANGFVVSNCGVRTLKTNLKKEDVEKNKKKLAEALFETVPAGLGSTGDLRMSVDQIDEILVHGAEYAVEQGYGFKADLEFTEEEGKVSGAIPENVSRKAKQRQFKQVGTLGSGNHYLEVQVVDKIFDEKVANAYGLQKDQILISIHCGSRALGHQIGTDYLKTLEQASKKYEIPIREKELVCAPFNSEEGQKYFSAVNCGINAAFANRQAIAHLTRQALKKALGTSEEDITTLYDVGHNTAKLEKHDGKELLVLRKGATRAFGPGREEIPKGYRAVGQPVLVGGTMGTSSFILHGTQQGMDETFGSSCHGAGRAMSRQQAKQNWKGEDLVKVLSQRGILIKGHSIAGVAEEAPGAYKDIVEVTDVMHNSGIAKKVVEVKPMICIKG